MTSSQEQVPMLPSTVISCSRRTDIPHWYPGWLEEQLTAGSVTFRSPRGAVRTVSLAPEDVHSIVLISKNYGYLLHQPGLLDHLGLHNLYFHFTITGLGGSRWEPGVPGWRTAIAQAAELVARYGAERVNWRFDPVVHWPGPNGVESNLALFEQISREITELGIGSCTFSFAQWYLKSRRRAERTAVDFVDPSEEEKMEMAGRLAELAAARGLRLASCSGQRWATVEGVEVGHCIDGGLLTSLRPDGAQASRAKDQGQREECGCTRSVDIGSYSQRCGDSHCVYCYAM